MPNFQINTPLAISGWKTTGSENTMGKGTGKSP